MTASTARSASISPPSAEAYDIRFLEPEDLSPAPSNPNYMSDATFTMLKDAIRQVGFLQPVLATSTPEGFTIVDGFHRVRAAKELGLQTIPVVIGDFQDQEALSRAVQIGMNRLRGELNLADVAATVANLASQGWSREHLKLTGFTTSELDDLIATTKRVNDDIMASSLGGTEIPEDEDDEKEPEAGAKVFALELTFESKGDLQRAKRALRKAAPKGGDMAQGLLAILAGE